MAESVKLQLVGWFAVLSVPVFTLIGLSNYSQSRFETMLIIAALCFCTSGILKALGK